MLVRPTADRLIVWLADWLPVRPILTVSLVADWLSDPRLTDWLTDWLAGWLTVSLTDWLPVRPTADRLADRLTVSLTDWLPVRPTANWLASWLAFCTTDWLTVWMSDYLSELLIEWMIDCLCNRNAFGHSIRKNLKVNNCWHLRAQENANDQILIGFSFAFDWLMGLCEILRQISEFSETRRCNPK